VVGAVNMLVDISERKQAETRQRALIDEINHRVKNTLATVQSVAAQTIRGSGVPKQVREAFEARLLALSRTHDRLAQASWESADLAAIVDDVVAPYRDHPAGCIRLEGGSVDLTPKAALTLSMVLHELAANAAEHGALSDPAGDLHLRWRVATDRAEAATLELDWRERGGPPVRPPARRGFGTRLLERGIGHELAGEARLAFDAGGVHCRISLPLPRRCRA
jgi:two-component sensor histidine kinase